MENFVNAIQIYSCHMNEDKEKDVKDFLLKQYQVIGEYVDGAYPIWKLSGKLEDVKAAINNHWLLHSLNDPSDVMSQETMDILGFEMSEESKIDKM